MNKVTRSNVKKDSSCFSVHGPRHAISSEGGQKIDTFPKKCRPNVDEKKFGTRSS